MNTKTLALIIIFVALTIALNVAGPKIPAPYEPFLYYQIWEIPIVVAFLVLGAIAGLIISAINTLILTIYFNGGFSPLGPFYNLVAILSMMLGIYVPFLIAAHSFKTEKLASLLKKHARMITISATILGITLRIAITSVVNYFALQQLPPVGFSWTPAAALGFVPLGALFNGTLALYTIPVAFAIAVPVLSRFKLK
jgi:riboflavin transporter FmnP